MPTEDKKGLALFEQGAGSHVRVSRRTVVKGLAASALVMSGFGCAPSGSSPALPVSSP